ncbi:MAG: hypothetical protein ACTSRW_14530 [Candidatus Helarchaeota archaeon]
MGISDFIKKILSKDSSLENAKELEMEFDKLRNSINASAILIVGTSASYKGLPIISSTDEGINERSLAADLPDLVSSSSKIYLDVANREILEFTVTVEENLLYTKIMSRSLILFANLRNATSLKKLQNWVSKNYPKIMKLFNM